LFGEKTSFKQLENQIGNSLHKKQLLEIETNLASADVSDLNSSCIKQKSYCQNVMLLSRNHASALPNLIAL